MTFKELFKQNKEHVTAAVRANLFPAVLNHIEDPNLEVREHAVGVISSALHVKTARQAFFALKGEESLKNLVCRIVITLTNC